MQTFYFYFSINGAKISIYLNDTILLLQSFDIITHD